MYVLIANALSRLLAIFLLQTDCIENERETGSAKEEREQAGWGEVFIF